MSNITIRKKLDSLGLLRKSFELIGCINDISLTKGELQLLGYIAYFGFPKTREQKGEYYTLYRKSEPTINNLIFTLKKKGFLVKAEGHIIIHPSLKLNKRESISINIIIEHDDGH